MRCLQGGSRSRGLCPPRAKELGEPPRVLRGAAGEAAAMLAPCWTRPRAALRGPSRRFFRRQAAGEGGGLSGRREDKRTRRLRGAPGRKTRWEKLQLLHTPASRSAPRAGGIEPQGPWEWTDGRGAQGRGAPVAERPGQGQGRVAKETSKSAGAQRETGSDSRIAALPTPARTQDPDKTQASAAARVSPTGSSQQPRHAGAAAGSAQ